MPSPRKIAVNGTVVFISSSVEEGIMFPANPLIELIVLKSLSQAQRLHPGLKVCHFLVEGTHIHLLAVVENPQDMAGFMERFKTESAHAINRILGRKKRTLWCESYDSPIVLCKKHIIRKIQYIYANPSKDGLEKSIEQYPGLSSWEHFQNGNNAFETFQVPRSEFHELPRQKKLDERFYFKEVERLTIGRKISLFTIEPDAWMKCFGIEDKEEVARVNREIVEGIRELEEEFTRQRAKAGKGVIGARRLRETRIGTSYVPERSGRRMYCIGCPEDRKSFMSIVRLWIEQARHVLFEWRRGNLSPAYPFGLYPPSLPRLGNVVALTW